MDFKKAVDSYENALDVIQAELEKIFMENVLKPFCDKYNVGYFASMGRNWFENHNGFRLYKLDERRDILTGFYKDAREVLNAADTLFDLTKSLGDSYNIK